MAIISDYDEPEQKNETHSTSKPSSSQSQASPTSFSASFDPSKPLAFLERVFDFISRESDYLACENAEKEITSLVRAVREKKLKNKRDEEEAKALEEREKTDKRLKEEKKKELKVEEEKKKELKVEEEKKKELKVEEEKKKDESSVRGKRFR